MTWETTENKQTSVAVIVVQEQVQPKFKVNDKFYLKESKQGASTEKAFTIHCRCYDNNLKTYKYSVRYNRPTHPDHVWWLEKDILSEAEYFVNRKAHFARSNISLRFAFNEVVVLGNKDKKTGVIQPDPRERDRGLKTATIIDWVWKRNKLFWKVWAHDVLDYYSSKARVHTYKDTYVHKLSEVPESALRRNKSKQKKDSKPVQATNQKPVAIPPVSNIQTIPSPDSKPAGSDHPLQIMIDYGVAKYMGTKDSRFLDIVHKLRN